MHTVFLGVLIFSIISLLYRLLVELVCANHEYKRLDRWVSPFTGFSEEGTKVSLIDQLLLGALAAVSLVVIVLIIKILMERREAAGQESKASQPMEKELETVEPSEDVEGDLVALEVSDENG